MAVPITVLVILMLPDQCCAKSVKKNGIEKLNKLELRLYAKMLTRQKRINDYSYDESLVCDV